MIAPTFTETFHREVYPAIDPTRPELSAAGKVVLISGGGQGIGAAIAKNFAKAGASDIVITGRKQETLSSVKSGIESLPENKTRVHTFVADVTDETRTNEVFAEVLKNIGRIDVFVANAGYLHTPGPFADASIADLWRGFEVNVKGLIIGAQAFLKSATPDAVLINVSSGAAHFHYSGPMNGYASSKTAGVRILDAIGVENPGVRVYSIQPGFIATDMAAKAGQDDKGLRFDSGKSDGRYDARSVGSPNIQMISPARSLCGSPARRQNS